MNDLRIFDYQSKHIRSVIIDGVLWCSARDIADALGYSDSKSIFDKIPDDYKGVQRLYTPGGEQPCLCLTEPGIYFFLNRSDKEAALPFQKWISEEVIPTIRKTGSYSLSPDQLILAGYTAAVEKIKTLETKIESDRPKIELCDTAMNSTDELSMQEAAAVLSQKGLGRNNLFKFLIDHNVLINSTTPYRSHIDAKHFHVIEQPFTTGSGKSKINRKILVTQRGIDYIFHLIKKYQKEVLAS